MKRKSSRCFSSGYEMDRELMATCKTASRSTRCHIFMQDTFCGRVGGTRCNFNAIYFYSLRGISWFFAFLARHFLQIFRDSFWCQKTMEEFHKSFISVTLKNYSWIIWKLCHESRLKVDTEIFLCKLWRGSNIFTLNIKSEIKRDITDVEATFQTLVLIGWL